MTVQIINMKGLNFLPLLLFILSFHLEFITGRPRCRVPVWSSNHQLRGSTFHTATTKNKYQCAYLCWFVPPCRSVNFNRKTKKCSLNSETARNSGKKIVRESRVDFAEIQHPVCKEELSYCRPSSCPPLQKCVSLPDKDSYKCVQSKKGSEAVDCGTPPSKSNADIAVSSKTYRSKAHYVCKRGYTYSTKDATVECRADGVWTQNDGFCKVTCQSSSGFKRDTATGLCLKVHTELTNWFQAERICQSEGSRLVKIDSANKDRAVQKLVKKISPHSFIFVGASKLGGVWYWLDGSEFRYSNWGRGEPNSKREHCLSIRRNYGWNDFSCGIRSPFVCEKLADRSKQTRCYRRSMNIHAIENCSEFSWPGGSYALFPTAQGCPSDVFENGSIRLFIKSKKTTSVNFNLKVELRFEYIDYSFCVAKNYMSTKAWEPGTYCVFRVENTCPKGFQEGEIEFNGKVNAFRNSKSVPDHSSQGGYVKFRFCCREDGNISEPIFLPNSHPFIMFKPISVSKEICQEVKGMKWDVQWYSIQNQSDMDILRHSVISPHTAIINSKHFLCLCHYKPKQKGDNTRILVVEEKGNAHIMTMDGTIKSKLRLGTAAIRAIDFDPTTGELYLSRDNSVTTRHMQSNKEKHLLATGVTAMALDENARLLFCFERHAYVMNLRTMQYQRAEWRIHAAFTLDKQRRRIYTFSDIMGLRVLSYLGHIIDEIRRPRVRYFKLTFDANAQMLYGCAERRIGVLKVAERKWRTLTYHSGRCSDIMSHDGRIYLADNRRYISVYNESGTLLSTLGSVQLTRKKKFIVLMPTSQTPNNGGGVP